VCCLLVLKLFLVVSSYSAFKPQECQQISVSVYLYLYVNMLTDESADVGRMLL